MKRPYVKPELAKIGRMKDVTRKGEFTGDIPQFGERVEFRGSPHD